MSRTPLLQNKETMIGFSVIGVVAALFVVMMGILVSSLIDVYGARTLKETRATIDGTVLSEAVKLLNTQKN